MAARGWATMTGVPPLGLPKMRSWVGGMERPTFWASPLWSMRVKMLTFFSRRIASEPVESLQGQVRAEGGDDAVRHRSLRALQCDCVDKENIRRVI